MSIAVFNLNGIETKIQCTNQQTMKQICQNFGTKAQIDINKYLFLYDFVSKYAQL